MPTPRSDPMTSPFGRQTHKRLIHEAVRFGTLSRTRQSLKEEDRRADRALISGTTDPRLRFLDAQGGNNGYDHFAYHRSCTAVAFRWWLVRPRTLVLSVTEALDLECLHRGMRQ